MSTLLGGVRMLRRSFAWVVVVVVAPVGSMNVLEDWMFECMNALLTALHVMQCHVYSQQQRRICTALNTQLWHACSVTKPCVDAC